MRVLIVNDDGIQGKGLYKLAEVLSTEHEVTVVAPHTQKSGYSHSLSFHKTLTYAPYNLGLPVRSYSLTGTPCDCVNFAIHLLMKDALPDIVLCGINDDYNLGTDVVYSGTVNAAQEGTLLGFPSVAISLPREFAGDFTYPAEFIRKNLDKILSMPRTNEVCYSINFPSNRAEDVKGVRFATLGLRKFSDHYEQRENADGSGYLLLGEPVPMDNSSDSDVELVHRGYITVTPVRIQDTDHALLAEASEIELCL